MANDAPRIIVKKKKAHHAPHHGGAWKVAYADFVTAMMALFIVLWLLTQADMRLKQQIAQYFRQPGVLPGGSIINPESQSKSRDPKVVTREILVVEGGAEEDLLQEEKGTIERAIERVAEQNPELAHLKDQVIVQVTDQGLSIQVVDKGRNMLFDLSSSRLKPPVIELLKHLAVELGKLPNFIQIGGHTDSRPYPPASGITNWDLAFERANAARRVLETHGLWQGQIRRVVGYADSEPLVPENPLADENRRLSILAERRGAPPGAPQCPAQAAEEAPPPVEPG
jgi:chemotaxis protein MotB